MTEARNNDSKSRFKLWEISVFVFVLLILAAIVIPAIMYPVRVDREMKDMARVHELDISAFAYSQDHNAVYPFGASSTEIFQKLYDEKYLTQSAEVFLPANGKSVAPPDNSQAIKLKPENVSWDFVTEADSGLKDSDPSDLPIVFSDVDTAPTWRSGINNATITSSNPRGLDGVIVATLSQATFFVKAGSVPGEVPLTNSDFQPAPGVKYVTKKP